jgi:hypothetical protein
VASSVGLAPYILGKPLTFKHWKPPNFAVLPDLPKGQVTDRDDVEKMDVADTNVTNYLQLMPGNNPGSEDKAVQGTTKRKKNKDAGMDVQYLGDKVLILSEHTKAMISQNYRP